MRTRGLALVLFIATMFLVIPMPRTKPVVVDLPRPNLNASPKPWRPSAWAGAYSIKNHRRLAGYDPGITGGYGGGGSRDCRDCDGMGGHYVPEAIRRDGEPDMRMCDTCRGTGVAGVQ